MAEEVGHSLTLQIKLVTLIDFLYLNGLGLLTFTEGAPSFYTEIQG